MIKIKKANYKEKICTKCDKLYKPISSTQEWCKSCLEKTCLWCAKIFQIRSKAHENRAKFCSQECKKMHWKTNMVGEKAPNLKEGQRLNTIKNECKFCSKEYYTNLTHLKSSKFCCRKCFDNYNSKHRRGENSSNWKGGIAIPRNTIMIRREYKEWRAKVFERDNYTCQQCGDNKGGNLNAHHIKEYAKYKELRHDVNNGITLCKHCHKKVHGYKLDIQSELTK